MCYFKNGKWKNIPTDDQRLIPIFYVPIHPKDRDRRDCLGWSALYGANSAHWTCRTLSKWVIPDRFYVAFPYGVYSPEIVKKHRKQISSKNGFFLTFDDRSVITGEYLGFTFDAEDFKACRKFIRKEGTGIKVPNKPAFSNERLPIEERWSARFFSLDKVFKPVIIDIENKVEVPWYHNIDSWDGYCNYLGSDERKLVEKPHPIFMKYHEWNQIGVDDEE